MQLIKISDKVLINPDKISSVEIRSVGKARKFLVRVDGKEFMVDDAEKFNLELVKSGIGLGDQFFKV
jgi:hypothetical protein